MASAAAIHTHPGRVGGPRDPGRGAALTLPQPAQLLPKPSSCVPPFFSTAPPCTLRTPGTPRVPRWGGRGGGGCRGGARALPCLSFPTELGTVCGAPPLAQIPLGSPPPKKKRHIPGTWRCWAGRRGAQRGAIWGFPREAGRHLSPRAWPQGPFCAAPKTGVSKPLWGRGGF